jgi:hypothetical protein
MPRRGMCRRRNSTCHCEEAAAVADEAIPKLAPGNCFAEFTLSAADALAMIARAHTMLSLFDHGACLLLY